MRRDGQRLATWHRLERAGSGEPLDLVVDSYRDKVSTIAAAQEQGLVSTTHSAVDLLGLILQDPGNGLGDDLAPMGS